MAQREKLNISYVAQLARLNLTEEEKEKLTKELTSILSYVEQLNEINTDSVEATSHALNIENVYREDTVIHSGTAQEVLDELPPLRKQERFFKVPKVIEEN